MCVHIIRLSHVQLFATLLTIAHQALLSMGFSRQEYWSGLPCPPPRDLLCLEMEPMSLTSSVLGGGFFTTSTTWEAQYIQLVCIMLSHTLPWLQQVGWCYSIPVYGQENQYSERIHCVQGHRLKGDETGCWALVSHDVDNVCGVIYSHSLRKFQ